MKSTIVGSSGNGCVLWCGCCDVVRLEFGNIILRFRRAEFDAFCSNLETLDIRSWEEANRTGGYRRRVHIQVRPTVMTMAFSRKEMIELRRLTAEARAGIAVHVRGGTLTGYSLN